MTKVRRHVDKFCSARQMKRFLFFFLDEEDTEQTTANSLTDEQDPYFRIADPDREHSEYLAALERLEKRHREKVAKVRRKFLLGNYTGWSSWRKACSGRRSDLQLAVQKFSRLP